MKQQKGEVDADVGVKCFKEKTLLESTEPFFLFTSSMRYYRNDRLLNIMIMKEQRDVKHEDHLH